MQDEKSSNLPLICILLTARSNSHAHETKLCRSSSFNSFRKQNRAFYENKTAPLFLSPFGTGNYEQQNAIEEEDGRHIGGGGRALIWQQGSSKNTSFPPSCLLERKTCPRKVSRREAGKIFSILVRAPCCQIRGLVEG